MRTKQWIPLFVIAGVGLLLTGCGGGSTTNVQNQAAPPTSSLSIAFQPKPPGGLFINQTAPLTAIVSNDSSSLGVDWSLTCQSNNCGSLSPLHTDSGKSAVYTPPTGLPQNSETVNIVAYATSDHSKNVVTALTVSAFGSTLKGKYVLQTTGVDVTGEPYQFAGVVTLDGNGNITGGEQIYSDVTSFESDKIAGGSYFIGPDGRGTLTLNTADQNIGQAGIETFSLVCLSNAQALIAKIDDPNNPVFSSESAQGTMDLQAVVATPTAGYAFVVSGTDIASFSPTAYGGVLNIDSPNTISGTGSIADEDLGGSVTNKAAISGTVSSPDAFGAIKFSLTTDFSPTPIQLTGFIVDGTHIKLIETDNDGTGTVGMSTSGIAIGQGSATGTFTGGKSELSGNFVFGILGEDFSGLASSLAAAGYFTSDGAGHFAGYIDEFLDGFQISNNIHGRYSVDKKGTGRVNSFISIKDFGPGPEYIFYLTGNGNPPLILDADVNIGSFGGGLAYPAAATVSFAGRYGTAYTQSDFGNENDASGQFTVNSTAQTLSGVVDTNFTLSPGWDTALTGTVQPTTVPNRFTGTMSNQYFLPGPISVAYYLFDSAHGFFVETDGAQSSFGNFATRKPVCSTCP